MSDNPLTGEVSNSKLAAVFDSSADARAAAAALLSEAGLQPQQVKVVGPDEPDANIKLEPEGRGIWRTIVVAHVKLGIVGAILGAIAFGIMMWAGLPFVTRSPVAAAAATIAFATVGGLLLGGLVSIRPDHDRYVQATHDAMEARRTTVVVHALSKDEQQRASELLAARGAEVTATL
ncbi:riboflavin biosynthesis protein RibA [Luteimonas sp. Sa2BVA3]|uniref:Riboflavin biosynthesis protein RibA n=1 Tax=Luteimonas colneyensis TaxID=2762230 RepID=A0ABR8UFM4_9GAMM|nr:riboflavin biosynthesis protein RibA [Luteimonas colneyensis]MBD7986829.1 riboflavin biosynthesis protein RibA [Luteimonas colneyensis]